MKYISYILIAFASTVLTILMSLSSCSPHPQSVSLTNRSQVMTAPPLERSHQTQVNAQSSQTKVKIINFKYEPASLKLDIGETAQFINQDEEPHTVTAKDGSFNSKALDTDQTWTYTPTKPGTYPYFCSIHPYMKGTITVMPKGNKT